MAFHLKGLSEMMKGNIDLTADTIKLMFMDPAYTPNVGTHSYVSDISASRASGTTDVTLSSKTVTEDTGNSRVEFDCADISVPNETTSTDYIAVYKSTGVDSTSPVIATIAINEGTLSPVDGTLALTINAEGLFGINS